MIAVLYLLFHFVTGGGARNTSREELGNAAAGGKVEATATATATGDGSTRRREAAMSRIISEDELARHRTADDAWIAVRGLCYDITPHIVNHPGWRTAGQVSTVMAIMVRIPVVILRINAALYVEKIIRSCLLPFP